MKKYVVLFFTLLAAIGAAVVMTACEHKHNFKYSKTLQEATCTEEGLEEYVCRDCGYEETRTIAPTKHLWGVWKVTTEATCLAQGEETRICRNNSSHVETRTIDFADHDWKDWTIVTKATCTQNGEEMRICKTDPTHTESRVVNATNHNWSSWQVITKATCLTQGEEIRTCKNNPAHTETRVIDYAEHDWNEWQVVTPSTCSHEGEEVRTCKNAPSHTENRPIALAQHFWSSMEVITPSTCTTQGEAYRICKYDPAHRETFPLAIATNAHDWDEWEFDQPVTCLEQGQQSRFCKYNPAHKQERTLRGPHDWNEWETVTPVTCEENGKEIRTCKNDSTHTETQTIDALGHSDILPDWVTLQESTCLVAGTEGLLCSRCLNPLETRRTAALEHRYLSGACTHCGRRDWSTAQLDDPDLYNSEYCFRMLVKEPNGAAMQALYLLIDADARAYHSGNSDSSLLGEYTYTELSLTMDEAIAVWKIYLDDHPLYYWMSKTLTYTIEKLEVKIDEPYVNPEVRASLNQMIYEKANAWRRDTAEGAYLAALSYHDKIIYAVSYLDSKQVYPEGTLWAHNIIGVFEGTAAVCEGYARSFQLLLNMTGIENIYVSGMSDNTAHAWNLVKLDDGKWYSFDLTYDDRPSWMWGIKYNYFAVSENENVDWLDGDGYISHPRNFAANHTPDSGTGATFLVQLPEMSQTPYTGWRELRLRQTFTVGKLTYAVAGYKAVQLIKCSATGDVRIPETVSYDGMTYDVISAGGMNKDGTFADSFKGMFTNPIEGTLYIPASIRFLWTGAVHGGIAAFEVDEENEMFTSVDGVLFTKGMYTLIAYPNKSPKTEYTIPDGVMIIADCAFSGAIENLHSFTIGKDVQSAGNVNWGSGWLRSPTEGSHSFVVGRWNWVLKNLVSLKTLSVDPENQNFSAEKNLLFNKDKTILYAAPNDIVELVVPASVVIIDYEACYYRTSLTKVTFKGNAIKKIESSAFSNCYNLRSIVFNGTRGEWDAIEKDKAGLEEYNRTITCTKK